MKKLNWLFVFLVSLLFVSCESDIDTEFRDIFETNGQVAITFDQEGVATRSGGIYYNPPTVKTGDKIGIFSLSNGNMSGPKLYTLVQNNGAYTLKEPLEFQNSTHPHTFYCYFPDHNEQVSADPKKVVARTVFKEQYQEGTSFKHQEKMEFYVTSPAMIMDGDNLILNLRRVFTTLEFRINTNVDDLTVNSLKLVAPSDKVVAYKSGIVDITIPSNRPGFLAVSNFQEPSNTILLHTEDLLIPNSTTTYLPAYMVANPFNAFGEKIKVEVSTNKGVFTLEVDGSVYIASLGHVIDLRIEMEPETNKDIYVLSMCNVGFLGTSNTVDAKAPNWGVECGNTTSCCKSSSTGAIAMRRILSEHFGPGKTVETGTIYFEEAGHYDPKCKKSCCSSKGNNRDYNNLTDEQLARYNIIFLNKDTRADEAFTRRIMKWLNGAKDRVLMLAYDWKDPCLSLNASESKILTGCYSSTNLIFFRDGHIPEITPKWSSCVSGMMLPFELNERTSYFWKEGPFKTNLNEKSNQRYWIKDKYWGRMAINDPNVIPLVTYRNGLYDTCNLKHCSGSGDNGMVLGVNPAKRIVYIGDSELFCTEGMTNSYRKDARIVNNGTLESMNNYAKIMGNLWAWMIDEVIQKN